MKHKIFHIAFSRRGGAGNVAFTISEEMKSSNYNSSFLYLIDVRTLINILKNINVFLLSIIDNYIIKKNHDLPFFSILRSFTNSNKIKKELIKNSIIHLHWIPGIVNLRKLEKLKNNNFKVVVTLHDMWFFTGGCHFSNGCNQYVSGCRQCPMVRSIFRPLVARQYSKKERFFSVYKNSIVTSPSHSLLKKAASSKTFNGKNLHLIPNPISNDIQFLGSKIDAREITNLKLDFFVVGFVAADINDPRKNFKEALLAVRDLVFTHPEEKIKFIIIGGGFTPYLNEIPFIERIGVLRDPALLGTYYAAFDVLLHTSTEENSPLVLIEALVNNTYIISSDSGGSNELITSSQTGFIYQNTQELMSKLVEIYKSKGYENVNFKNILDYDPSQVASQYINLYETFE